MHSLSTINHTLTQSTYQPTSTKAVTPNTPEPTDTSKLVQNGNDV